MGAFSFIVFTIGLVALLVNTSLQYELQPQLCKRIDNSCKKDDDCCLGTCCFSNECLPSWDCSPCKNITCPVGQSCYLDERNRPAGGKWNPVCAADNPCLSTDCGACNVCQLEQTANNPPVAKCVTARDVCADVTCPGNSLSCYAALNCSEASCHLQPVCSYTNPCRFLDCGCQQECIVYQREGVPRTARCSSAGLTCENVICPRQEEKCFMSDEDSCDGRSTPVCANPNPCSDINCSKGLVCKEYKNGSNPPTATCVLKAE